MTLPIVFSTQANKAWNAAGAAVIASVGAYVTQGGLSVLASLTLGQWLAIVGLAFAAFVTTYNTPNAVAASDTITPDVLPDLSAATTGAPVVASAVFPAVPVESVTYAVGHETPPDLSSFARILPGPLNGRVI